MRPLPKPPQIDPLDHFSRLYPLSQKTEIADFVAKANAEYYGSNCSAGRYRWGQTRKISGPSPRSRDLTESRCRCLIAKGSRLPTGFPSRLPELFTKLIDRAGELWPLTSPTRAYSAKCGNV